jgi:xanthine dehydrogenase accessory factor
MENRRMQAWLTDLQQLLTHGDAAVLVTVARVEGSAPREAGTKMIVTRDSARHTIGGGHLEWKAIETARQVLKEGMRVPHMRRLER